MARRDRRDRGSRRGGGRGRKGNAGVYILGAMAALGIIGLVGSGGYFMYNRRPIDPVTQCPTDHIDSIAAVVIDLTDPITKTQSIALENTLTDIRDGLPKFGRLDLYTIVDAAGSARDPIFSLCNPGSGAQVTDNLTGNKDLADRLWKRKFGDKLKESFDAASRVTPMEASPIFEAIHFAAVRSFGGHEAEAAPAKKLVVISDLIHNFRDVNMYKRVPTFNEFRRSSYYATVAPRLRGVELSAQVIYRETSRNVQFPNAFRDFWDDYVRDAGGTLVEWKRVQ